MKNGLRPVLPLIVVAYATLGVLYAACTPPWQVPDEPAHYNYIRALAEEGLLPVMEEGDYDQGYLQQLTEQRFPPDMPIAALTYEDHQPPLYYLIAAPFYLLFDGALLPLRLLSVALGTLVLLIAYGVIRTLFPNHPFLAITATALIAFLPQHVAMTAGVNNDTLAEVALGLVLWTSIRYATGQSEQRPTAIRLGLTLGLALLTKTSAFVALPVALVAVAVRAWRQGEEGPADPREAPLCVALGNAGWMLLAAALLAGPYLIRNVALYGWNDPLGLARHNAVVVGQLRTTDALAQYGWPWLLERGARFTFQSFWGQFGWMGVPLQPAVYLALALFSALLLTGFLGWLLNPRRARLAVGQRDGLLLLTLSAVLTMASYFWYNLTFVQHQGRYLFPALIPLALGAALGLEWLLAPHTARWAAAALAGVGVLLLVWGILQGDLALIPTATAFGLAALVGLPLLWPAAGRWATVAWLGAGLVVLNLHALFGAIVPMLGR